MRTTSIFTVVILLSFLNSCAPSRFVKPLKKEQNAITFSFGGPIIEYSGVPVPVPFTTLAYGYGITDKITGYGSLHTTSLLFGNLQTDIGATFLLFEKEKQFGISVSPALQAAFSLIHKTGFKVWPTADLNTWFHFKESPSYIYAGINSWIELSRKRSHNEEQPRFLIPNLHLGYVLVEEKWNHQFQLGYLGMGIPNLPGVVGYKGLAGKGALSFHYGLIRLF